MSVILHNLILSEVKEIIGGFAENIQKVFEYTGEYGIKKVPVPIAELEKISPEIKYKFQSAVHEGFGLAQIIILKEITKCLKLKNRLKTQIKIVSDSEEKKYYRVFDRKIDKIILIYRHFSDFVVWQIFKGNHQKIRESYLGGNKRPSLLSSNIESLERLIPVNNAKFPGSFSLMTDLTSFFDIGDLIVIHKDEIRFTEVKEGKINHSVFDFLEFLENPSNKIEDYDYSNFDEKFIKQSRRVLNQKERDLHFLQAVGTLKEKHFLIDNASKFDYFDHSDRYYDEFENCFWKAFEEEFELLVIENIVYIGMFTGPKQHIGDKLMKSLQLEYLGEDGKLYDYDDIFIFPIVEPLLFKPYGKDVFMNIFLDHITIKMFVNISELRLLFMKMGYTCEWTSRKVSQKIYDKYKDSKDSIFRWNNKSLRIEKNGNIVYLTDYFIHRLLFDAVKPSYFIKDNKP